MMTAGAGTSPGAASFDGGPGTPARAREHAAAFLTALTVQRPSADPACFDRVLLVVSELVTNAVRHAPGPVHLCLALLPGEGTATIRITVGDTSAVLPTPRTPDFARGTGGFGWSTILRPLTTGLQMRPHPGGKEIEALLPW